MIVRFGIKFQIGRKDIVIDAEIEKARIEYEKGQESLWSRSWNHEIESIDAIGAVLYDEAEYFAEADELPDFLRDFCRGISGEHTKTTIPGLLGAGVVGLAKSGAELGKLGSKFLGHPQDTTEEFANGTINTLQNIDKIPDAAKQWWDTTSTYEKFTTVVEFWATCKVFQELFSRAEGETVRLESEAVSDVSKGTKATSKIAEVEDGINAVEKAGVEVGKISETSYGKSTLNSLKNTENFTDSAIEHIFEGQVNARGKAVGYHYDEIENTAGKVVVGTESIPNNLGIYKAQVEVSGIPKTANGGFSSFYPKGMSPQQVIDAINEAYNNCDLVIGTRNTYRGITTTGMEIDMYLDQNKKNISAFPKE